jgi:hypothetical protein
VIAKINLFFIIFTDISPYFEAEKVPLFCKNLVRTCGPLGYLRGGRKISKFIGDWRRNSHCLDYVPLPT